MISEINAIDISVLLFGIFWKNLPCHLGLFFDRFHYFGSLETAGIPKDSFMQRSV